MGAFVWRYRDPSGAVVGASEVFADRAAAEAWVEEGWSELAGRGVAEVELVEAGEPERSLYRMSLSEG